VATASGGFDVTFIGDLGDQAVPLLTADASKLVKDTLLVYDQSTGELDFNFDLGTSVQIARPFSLDLRQLFGLLGLTGTLASVANSLVGVGASGNLSVNASAALHIKLGLDLNIVSMTETHAGTVSQDEVQTLVIKGTSGSFKLMFPFDGTPQNLVATAGTGGTLAANTYYYVVTSLIGTRESSASEEVSATLGSAGTITLNWDDLPAATGGYRVYRGTSAGGEDHYQAIAAGTHTLTDDGTPTFSSAAPPPAAPTPESQTTDTISWSTDSNAMATDIQTKLQALGNIGAGNVTVTTSSGTVTAGSPQTFVIEFVSNLQHMLLPMVQVDDSDLHGQRSFFIKTGPSGTSVHLDASASASNLNFVARIGPFGLFVKNGSAAIGGAVNLSLNDPHNNGRLILVDFGGDGVGSDLGNILSDHFVDANSVSFTGTQTDFSLAATAQSGVLPSVPSR